jgi:hypothetical protein
MLFYRLDFVTLRDAEKALRTTEVIQLLPAKMQQPAMTGKDEKDPPVGGAEWG